MVIPNQFLQTTGMGPCYPPLSAEELAHYRSLLNCSFTQLDSVFEECMTEARALLSDKGVADYLEGASLVSMIGRGFDPILTYLEEMPQVAHDLGEQTLSMVSQAVWKISRTANGRAIPSFVQTIGEVSRRLGCADSLEKYIVLVLDMMERTAKSVYGWKATSYPSPGAIPMFESMPALLHQLSLGGLKNWIEYGIRNYHDYPERQEEYFKLASADSRAVMQRERHGTLFVDNDRKLDLYLRAMWPPAKDTDLPMLVPYSEAFDELRKPQPYYDPLGVRIPDVYDDYNQITGLDRYRAALAHMAAHQRWSSRLIADNYSPFQRLAVEIFEDCRMDTLSMQRFPGLRRIIMALHPRPDEWACDVEHESCLRHRMAMVSYAMLNPDHGYENAFINEFAQKFRDIMAQGKSDSKEMTSLGLSFVARTRVQSDQLPRVHFKDTEVSYRDDNRHLWQFIEEGDEEEIWDKREAKAEEANQGLPPRHYPEWDYKNNHYRPDWVSLYETLHPSGNSADIDKLLAKHDSLAKRLKRLLDMLKPQNFVRVRYQEDGSELDLDVAIRSLIDLKSGSQPDPRINMSHKHNDRNIAVLLLLDLSASLNEKAPGSGQTILELSQEAVALTSWAVEALGDEFAIAGFNSNSRHEVRYYHIKGFTEHWDEAVKGRLAAMEAAYSTRMGAAMRHAAHYLESRKADKKLLLVLTDGEPADIDVHDDKLLIHDTHKAVQELDQKGIFTYCINLDPRADEYVKDVFGQQYTVIDRVERLPEKLPALFMSLTK